MAEENLNNENPTPDFDPGFDLGKYIENDYVEPVSNTNLDINAALGYDPEEELSKYMAETFKTSVDAGMMDLQDLEDINEELKTDPLSIDSIRTKIDNEFLYRPGAAQDPFGTFRSQLGDFRDPNNQNTFYKRYYEHPDFDKLGFSPFRNNEEYYNENSSLLDEFRRAGGEMLTLAGIGIAENFGLSDLDDINTAKKYAEASAIGTSSKKGGLDGLGAFAANTFLNSGYTLGLIAGFAVEEAALIGLEIAGALATPVTAGTSSAVTAAAAARQAYSVAKFGKNLKKAYEAVMKSRKLVDKVQEASKARKFFNASMDFLNPLENTTRFFKQVDQMEDLSRLTKTVRGAGAFIKDTRGARAAWNEAALEANMVQDEMQRKMLSDFRKKNGRSPNKDEAASIAQTIKDATTSTATWNAALILGTNKLTLGPLMRPMDKALGGGIFSLGKAAGNVIMTASKKGVPEAYKLLSANYFKRSLELLRHPKALLQRQLLYSTDNFAEGFQEVSQETIADWQKEYHTSMFEGNETRGGYYDFLAKSFERQLSPEGFEVFMSGFLMQKFVSPVVNTVGSITDKQNYADLRLFATDREAYYKAKKDRRKQDEKIVQDLNDYFTNNTEYLAGDFMELVRQGEYAKMLKNAESIGDTKSWHDIKDTARFGNFMNLIRYGRLDRHLDLLRGLKDLTADEVRQEYNMELEAFHDVIDKSVERAKAIESTYKGLTEKMPNPVNYKQYKYGTPEYMDAYMAHQSWNDVLETIAFNKFSIKRALERTGSITENFQKIAGLEEVSFSDISVLFGKDTLVREKQTLEQEIELLKQSALMTAEIKESIKQKEEKLKLLEEYNSNLDAIISRSPNEMVDDPAYKPLEKAFENYMKFIADNADQSFDSTQVEETLKEVIDYYKLASRVKGLNKAINLMVDPEGFNQLFKRNVDIYTNANASMKEEIEKSYQAYKKGNKLHNDLVNALADMGVFVTLEELEKLRNEGVFPKHFFYESPSEDNLEVAHNSEDYRKIVELMREYFDIKEGIDLITFDEQFNMYNLKSRNKNKDDKRTYAELAEQFGFKEGDEVSVKEVLEAIINSRFADSREKALAEVLLGKVKEGETIVFSMTQSLPAEYKPGEDKVSINATYSANEYKQGRNNSPLEHFILHGLIQKKLDEALDQDPNFKADMQALLDEANEAWETLTEEEQQKFVPKGVSFRGLDNINDFAFAAMTNLRFQKFLGVVRTPVKTDRVSLWKKFVDTVLNNISKIFGIKVVEGTVLNAALDLITGVIDPQGVTPSTAAPKSTGTTPGVTRAMPVDEIKANHPDLYNSLIDAFIKYNDTRVEQGNDSVIPENATRDAIGQLPFFKRFVNDRAFTSPDKIFKEYNAKIGSKPGATTTTPTTPASTTTSTKTDADATTTPTDKRTMPKAPSEEIVFIPPKGGKPTRAVSAKLRELGFTAADIKNMTDEQAYRYANDNLTKEESKAWYDFLAEQGETLSNEEQIRQDARTTLNEFIESASTWEQYLNIQERIFSAEFDKAYVDSGYTYENLQSLLQEKRKRLAFMPKFDDIKVGEYVALERTNKKGKPYVAIVKVSDKTKNEIIFEHMSENEDGTVSTFKINKKDLKNMKVYRSSQALKGSDIDGGAPTVNPQDNDAAKGTKDSVDDFADNTKEDEAKADSKTSDEVNDDLTNAFKNNCK